MNFEESEKKMNEFIGVLCGLFKKQGCESYVQPAGGGGCFRGVCGQNREDYWLRLRTNYTTVITIAFVFIFYFLKKTKKLKNHYFKIN